MLETSQWRSQSASGLETYVRSSMWRTLPLSPRRPDKGNSFKAGTPIVAVGTLLATRTADQLTVKIENSGSVRATLPVAPNSIDNTFAVDLTSANLGPGPYLVSFVDKERKARLREQLRALASDTPLPSGERAG